MYSVTIWYTANNPKICHISHKLLNTFHVCSKYTYMLLAHSPHTLNTFCILLETLKEQYFERSNGGYILAQDEQLTNFIFGLSLKNCSLLIWRICIITKNGGKLSTSQFIMVQHKIIVDPFFLY